MWVELLPGAIFHFYSSCKITDGFLLGLEKLQQEATWCLCYMLQKGIRANRALASSCLSSFSDNRCHNCSRCNATNSIWKSQPGRSAFKIRFTFQIGFVSLRLSTFVSLWVSSIFILSLLPSFCLFCFRAEAVSRKNTVLPLQSCCVISVKLIKK